MAHGPSSLDAGALECAGSVVGHWGLVVPKHVES